MGRKENFDKEARNLLGVNDDSRGGRFTVSDANGVEPATEPPSLTLPRAIEFRRKASSWFSFPYHCLMSVEYTPHSRIEITFSTHRVTISGWDLGRVYREIRLQYCAVLEEAERAVALVSDSGCVIAAIDVTARRGHGTPTENHELVLRTE